MQGICYEVVEADNVAQPEVRLKHSSVQSDLLT